MHILTTWLSMPKFFAALPLICDRRCGQATTKTRSNTISYAMKNPIVFDGENYKKTTRSFVSQKVSQGQTQKNICLLAQPSHSHLKLRSSKYLHSFCLIQKINTEDLEISKNVSSYLLSKDI